MRIRIGLSVGFIALLAASAVQAVLPPTDVTPSAEIPLPTQYLDRVADSDLQSQMSLSDEGLRQMNAKYGLWHVGLWNEITGAPERAFGEPIPLVSGQVDETSIVEASRLFIQDNAGFLRADPASLELVSAIFRGRHWYVHFGQNYHGIPVYNSMLFLRFDARGNLIGIGSNLHPEISLTPWPAVSEAQALSAAKLGLPFTEGTDAAELKGLVVVPVPWERTIGYFLTYQVDLTLAGGTSGYRAYVDATTGGILWRHTTVYSVDLYGNVSGETYWEDPDDTPISVPFPNEDVRKTYGGGSDYTDENGDFLIENTGSDPVEVSTTLDGFWFDVQNQETWDASQAVMATPGEPIEFYWDDTNSMMAERVPYYHLNVFHDHIKYELDPAFVFRVTFMPANVNIGGQTCNAFFSGNAVNYYRRGGGCIDMSTMASVVTHEYGHGITDWIYYPVQVGCNMIEAFPDIRAMYHTGISTIGTGYRGPGTKIRDGENLLTWQQALDSCPTGGYNAGECHCKAQVTMGAMWKMFKNYRDRYGAEIGWAKAESTMHFSMYGKPYTPAQYLVDVLQEDDDDGNLNNGSPNWEQICSAFAIHGLDCPAITEYVTIVHAPYGDTVNDTTPYAIAATITATGDVLDPDDLWVYYTVNGGAWNSVAMVPSGPPDEYAADIPPQALMSYVEYYIRASGMGGAVAYDPPNAPQDRHLFVVGTLEVAFEDDMETDLGWEIVNDADDGFWVLDDPNGTWDGSEPVNPEDDASPAPGVKCYFTGQGEPGGPPYLGDLDGGCTTLITPVIDGSMTNYVRVKFARWFYNDHSPDSDALTVELSTDGGTTWTALKEIRGIQNEWIEDTFHLKASEYDLTSEMQLRFRACDENQYSWTEAAVDEFYLARLTESQPDDVAMLDLPARFRVEQNAPNPFNPATAIRFEVPTKGPVSIRVYSVAGQLVRTLLQKPVEAGYHTVRWDGTNDAGEQVGSGVYYYKVTASGFESVHKMALLK